MVKGFRDRPADFPVYGQGFDSRYLDSLGPLVQPRRPNTETRNVTPLPMRRSFIK